MQQPEGPPPDPPPTPPAATALALELALPPEALPGLLKGPALAAMQCGKGRTDRFHLIWYDTPDGRLGARGLALELAPQRRGARQALHRTMPADAQPWLPGAAPELLAEARLPTAAPDAAVAGLGQDVQLVALAACEGRRRRLPLLLDGAPATLLVEDGTLRAVAAETTFARLSITAVPATALAIARRLAAEAPLLPAPPLAEAARAIASGALAPARRGPPDLSAAETVEQGLVHALLHLAAVLLSLLPRLIPGHDAEAVHQMRVALRRLRSAIAVWREAAGGTALEVLDGELRELGRMLAPVRDRDVFLGGALAAIDEAFHDAGPAQRAALAGLRAALGSQRDALHARLADWLQGPALRGLVLSLLSVAATRAWREAAPGEAIGLLESPLPDYAARVLRRRHRKLMKEPKRLDAVPVAVLHAMRLRAKRLRYAAEFFAGLFPDGRARRYLRRLAVLQEALGHVNDTAVAADLVGALPQAGGRASAGRAWAVGAVQGFAAGRAAASRDEAARAWARFRKAGRFWED